MKALTKRQKETLEFVTSFEERHGFAPTVREIAKAIGVSSTSTAHRQLASLYKKGFLQKEAARSWRGSKIMHAEESKGQFQQVSIIGSISKESRIELFASITTHLFPGTLLKENSTYYGFLVADNSFAEHLIVKGDIIIIDSEATPTRSDLVLLRSDGVAAIAEFASVRKSQQLLGKIILTLRSTTTLHHQPQDQNH